MSQQKVGPPSPAVSTKHPLKRVLAQLPKAMVEVLPRKERERFQMVVSSIACPMAEIFESYNKEETLRVKFLRDWRRSVSNWTKLHDGNDSLLTLAKWEFNLYLQKAFGDLDSGGGHVAPPHPFTESSPHHNKRMFVGYVKNAVDRVVARARACAQGARGSNKSISFCVSLQQCKRGWPELAGSLRAEALRDHQSNLSALPAALELDMKNCIRNTARMIFTKPGLRSSQLTKFSPSIHASFESSRREGGARGYLKRVMGLFPRFSPAPGHQQLRMRDVVEQVLSWKRQAFNALDDIVSFGSDTISTDFDAVKVKVIPEPGKFRIITTGSAIQYTWLQPLQGALLSFWKTTRWSSMRRNEEWESDVLAWKKPLNWVYCSGDYKAATDKLNMNATLEVFQEVKSIFSLPDNFRSGLDGVTIQYDDDSPGVKPSVQQSNGQLMGHPLSFPILCTINIAALICACERAVRRGLISRAESRIIRDNCKVNGDDILFICPPSFVPFWESVTRSVGLVPSAGKCYVSKRYALINSVYFDMSKGRKFGYINQSLIYAHSLKRAAVKEGETGGDTPLEIGNELNKMFSLCPYSQTYLTDALSFRDDRKVIGYTPNFFMSPRLGGFGVDRKLCRGRLFATLEQRKVGRLFAAGMVNEMTFQIGLKAQSQFNEIMARIPKKRLSTTLGKDPLKRLQAAKSIGRYYVDQVSGPVIDEVPFEASVVNSTQAEENLSSWVAFLSDPLLPRLRSKRVISWTKSSFRKWIDEHHPLSQFECFSLEPEVLCPYLPKLPPPLTLHYQQRRIIDSSLDHWDHSLHEDRAAWSV